MSKLTERVNAIIAEIQEDVATTYQEISETHKGYQERVNAINEELVKTTYTPRRKELIAERNSIMEKASKFYDDMLQKQRELAAAHKKDLDALIIVTREVIDNVVITDIDRVIRNADTIKDIANFYTHEQLSEAYENMFYRGKSEQMVLLTFYVGCRASRMKGSEKYQLSKSVDYDRVINIITFPSEKYGNSLYTDKWNSYDTKQQFLDTIFCEADPWKAPVEIMQVNPPKAELNDYANYFNGK